MGRSPEEFAAKIAQLHDDEKLWVRLREELRTVVLEGLRRRS